MSGRKVNLKLKKSKEPRNDKNQYKVYSQKKLSIVGDNRKSHHTNRQETPKRVITPQDNNYLSGKRSAHMMNRQFEDQFMMDRQISSKRAKASPGGISSKYQPCDSKRSHRPSYTTLEHEREKIDTML